MQKPARSKGESGHEATKFDSVNVLRHLATGVSPLLRAGFCNKKPGLYETRHFYLFKKVTLSFRFAGS